MRQVFRSQFKITQEFGNNPAYYGQFGLKGHEGIDLIPTGTVWDVLCLEDGVVVTDVDNPASGAYGVYVTVWHPKIKKATQYCHFKENYVKNGDVVTKGQKLGLMGSSGNTQGAHLHLNLYETDENGVRLNKSNGYNGGIDPKPFLNEDDALPVNSDQAVLDQLRAERDKNWNLYQGELQAKIALEDIISSNNKTIKELEKVVEDATFAKETAQEAVQRLTEDNLELSKDKKNLTDSLEKALLDLGICKSQRKDLGKYLSEELKIELRMRKDVSFITKIFL